MGKFTIFVLIVILFALGFFAYSNNEPVTVKVPFGAVYEISKIALMLFSAAFGAFFMLLIVIVRDTKRFMATYQFNKKQRKEEKIQSIYSKAVTDIIANDEPGAKGLLEEILKIDSGHEDALLRLGDMAVKRERYDEAKDYYRRVLDANPRSIEAMLALEEVLEKTAKWRDALNLVEEIIEADPDNLTALSRKRTLLEREGRWDELIDLQKTILKHSYTDKAKENQSLLGYRYEHSRECLEKEEFEKAIKGFRIILKEDRDFIPAYLGGAEAMLREGEAEDALDFLEKGYEQTASPIILARLEDMLINLGEPARLIRTYRAALSRDPGNNMLRFFLGKLYFRLEMIEDAFETLSSPDMLDPYPELYQLLGELYLRRNQYDKAVAEFKRSINMKKTFRLPYCCMQCGHIAEDWSGRCPACGNWNSYRFNLYGSCKA